MALIPPIPPFPQLPYPLPFGYEIDKSHILSLPPEDDFDPCAINCFLDCLVRQRVMRTGCDWVIVVNRKVYYIKWRDVAPRGPWTRCVWDIFRIIPGSCGCPSMPRMLGMQWDWATVIKTIREDVFSHWQNGDISGSKQTVVAIGTNALQPAQVGFPQVGPVLYLDAADASTITLDGGAVAEWADKSSKGNHALQTVPANRPTVATSSLNGLDTLRFDAGLEQFMDVELKALSDYHLLVVGRFFFNNVWPRGTFFSAAGFEGSFGGAEGKIYQDDSVQPNGTPFTFINPSEVPMVATTLSAGTFGILEYRESVSTTGYAKLAVNAFEQQVFSGDTSDDYWDPTRQTFGEPEPLPAAVGRSNWGINPLRTFDYLDGNIGQILLYPRVLAEGERVQILNVLRAKWGLGAPLNFPP